MALILTPTIRASTSGYNSLFTLPGLEGLTSDLATLYAVFDAHARGLVTVGDRRPPGAPHVKYLHAESPLQVVLAWLGRSSSPTSWIEAFAKFVATVYEFPSEVRRVRYEKRAGEVQARISWKQALVDERALAIKSHALDRAEVLDIVTGDANLLREMLLQQLPPRD
jgi:hypothetical protein